MTQPFFSVLLPVYNAAAHIADALQDLYLQTFRDFEIIVVDDGSSDGSGDIVRAFNDPRIRLITLPENRGLVGALNTGLAEARGEWIARQDADDRCRRNRLEIQRGLILQNRKAVFIYSRATLINQRGWWRGMMRPPLSDSGLRWDLCFRNAVPHTSAVFPTHLVRSEMGGYSGDNVTADFDLWSRLLQQGEAMGERQCLVSYRNHSGSIMGRENMGGVKRSNTRLATIMQRNLREWLEASEGESKVIATAWLEPAKADWGKYFLVREKLASSSLAPVPSVIAEEDYALMHRATGISRECVSLMLHAMKSVSPVRFASLPQPRTLLSRMVGGF
jgi:glycosyltransferase involved in cell wall biosynthesis